MTTLTLVHAFQELRDLGWVGRRTGSMDELLMDSAKFGAHVLMRLDENGRSLQGSFGEATSTDLGEPWSDFLKRSGYPIDESRLVESCSTYHDTIHAAMRRIREDRKRIAGGR